MKRKIVLIVLFILIFLYLQLGFEPYVNNAITSSASNGYELNLTITMNKIVIFNRQKVEQDLINHILNNDFKNMQFSYDIMGYPQEISVIVYTNSLTKYLRLPDFSFRFAK